MGILKNANLVESHRKDHWVMYKIKEEAFEFVSWVLAFMEKEAILMKDRSLCDVLFTNRELSINKLELKQYKPDSLS